MTGKRSDEQQKLAFLADALFDDLFETSDADILAEFREAGGDAKEHGQKMRAVFEDMCLQAAKAGAHAARPARPRPAHVIDIRTARRVLRAALDRDGVSIAARNEKESEMTDDEVMEEYLDMIELGLIDPSGSNGNKT